MANKKDYSKMSADELAKERIHLDQQIQEIRAEKKKIQDEVDRRLLAGPVKGAHNIANAGGIESEESVGKNG